MTTPDARGVPLHVAQERSTRIRQLAVPLEHDAPLEKVRRRVDQHALGLETVTTRSPRFLLVVLERLRRACMHDEPDVGPIDPHAERDRCDDDVRVLVEERILIPASIRVGHPGVVAARTHPGLDEPCGECVDFLP